MTGLNLRDLDRAYGGDSRSVIHHELPSSRHVCLEDLVSSDGGATIIGDSPLDRDLVSICCHKGRRSVCSRDICKDKSASDRESARPSFGNGADLVLEG